MSEVSFSPKYPISYEVIDEDAETSAVDMLISSYPELAKSNAKFGLVHLDSNSPYGNLARSVESGVFMEFFDNNPDLMLSEYGPYEDASSFLFVIDKEAKKSAGVMRLLSNSENGFKSCNDLYKLNLTPESPAEMIDALGINPETTLEIATIAIPYEYRGKRSDGLVSAAMYRALHRFCQAQGYNDLIAIIDEKPLSNLIGIHLPIRTPDSVSSPFEYLDAKANSFIHIPVNEVDAVMRAADVNLYNFLLGEPGGLVDSCDIALNAS